LLTKAAFASACLCFLRFLRFLLWATASFRLRVEKAGDCFTQIKTTTEYLIASNDQT
jgi:hypothetical protein